MHRSDRGCGGRRPSPGRAGPAEDGRGSSRTPSPLDPGRAVTVTVDVRHQPGPDPTRRLVLLLLQLLDPRAVRGYQPGRHRNDCGGAGDLSRPPTHVAAATSPSLRSCATADPDTHAYLHAPLLAPTLRGLAPVTTRRPRSLAVFAQVTRPGHVDFVVPSSLDPEWWARLNPASSDAGVLGDGHRGPIIGGVRSSPATPPPWCRAGRVADHAIDVLAGPATPSGLGS